MSNPSGPSHRNVASIRSPPSTNPAAPTSPHTPLRTISSAFGSPSAVRAEEEHVIIELGSRYLRAGIAGDALPKAVLDFGPDSQRRAGDYRKWSVGYDKAWRGRIREEEWGESYELWRPDLRGLDLGLVADKLERAVRETAKHLIVDVRPRRVTLVLPSALPLPLLSTILDTLFTNFLTPTISLLPGPGLVPAAAGLQSALVVDIGWAETVVSGIYQYREVQTTRSTRATKMLGEEMNNMLAEMIDPASSSEATENPQENKRVRDVLSFEECEEIISRMAWCKPLEKEEHKAPFQGLTPVKEEDELRASVRSLHISSDEETDPVISIPVTSTKSCPTLRLRFSKLAEPCEKVLFADGTAPEQLDDEEMPLHLLVYRSLLKLPRDVRSICMSRIIFVGGGSNLPGLKRRVLDEVAALIEQRGWDPVQGKAIDSLRNNPKLQRTRSRQASNDPTPVLHLDATPASVQPQEPDEIGAVLKKQARERDPPVDMGQLRAVESLGAWSGGSLLSHLKIPAVSVVEREQWLLHGAAGASRTGDITVSAQRQSMGPGAFNVKSGAGDRSSWTLGLWG